MANVVDALIVTLGLDAKDFQKGRKEVDAGLEQTKKRTEKAGKDISASGKQGAEFFGQMQKAALKFFAVLAAARGVTAFVSQTITMGANLSRASRNLNMSANDLQKWGNAVKQSGGDMQGFLGTIQGLSGQLTEIQMTGQSAMTPLLNFLNVGVADASGKAKELDRLILDIAEGLERSPLSRSDKFNWLTGSGFDAGTANVILRGRKEAEAFVAKQVGMSDEMAKKLEAQEQRWEAIKQKLRDIGVQMMEKLLPAMEGISEAFTNIFDSPGATKFADNLERLVDFTAKLRDTALEAGNAYERMLDRMGLLKKDSAGVSEGELVKRAKSGDMDAARSLARMQLQSSLWHKITGFNESDVEDRARQLHTPSRAKSTLKSTSIDAQIANAEASAGLPAGLLASVLQQEVGGRRDEFISDPSKYHYEADARGKRKSSAFGPFGILDSTAKDPGYGVSPLANKSLDEQLRFASQYLAARIKSSGSVSAGLAGYGEGAKYAGQVMGRLPDMTGGGVMSGIAGAGAGRGSTNNTTTLNFYSQTTDPKASAREAANLVHQANTGMF